MLALGGVLAVGIFEVIVWTLDPFGVHTALNNGEPMEWGAKITSSIVNSMFFFALALVLWTNKKPTNLFKYLLIITYPFCYLFFSMQTMFWWLPYFAQMGNIAMNQEHAQQLQHLHRILPPLQDSTSNLPILIPDIEHTILWIMTIIMLFLLFIEINRMKPLGTLSWILAIIIGNIPLVFTVYNIISPDEQNEDEDDILSAEDFLVPSSITALLSTITFLFFTIMSTQNTKKQKRQ